MRIAWFTGSPTTGAALPDDTRSLLAELGRRHLVVHYDERRAHDFVWQHGRQPFDAIVYELDDTLGAAFIWPYLLHYPGVLRLRSPRFRRRREWLHLNRRRADEAVEAAFARADTLRIPFTAARLIVVGDALAAQALQALYPWTRIRHAPIAVPDVPPAAVRHAVPVFGVAAPPSMDLVRRAAERARDAGSVFDVAAEPCTDAAAIAACDAIVAIEWPPPPEPPPGALLAIAAGRPAIVFELPATAGWPALDPQTWRPRGALDEDPIVISLDPRDDEHSLMLAIRRLADDAALRTRMGEAAGAWSRSRTTVWTTVPQAADAWDRILADTAALDPPPRPADWPPHLSADGTARVRELLREIGAGVDFLDG